MRIAPIILLSALLLITASPARALDLDRTEPGTYSREPGSIVMTEMLLAAVSASAMFSPEVYGGLLLVSAPVVHFAAGKESPPLLRWGMPLFYATLGIYNVTVLADDTYNEARIFRENFAAWNGLYIYALTHSPAQNDSPLSAGVSALPGRVLLTASLRF
ncbi:MAG: hypothetical protein OEY97_00425 [Nitrospirota bacterium]|nr:hypothetical protein [Nitrospirota bacterium]